MALEPGKSTARRQPSEFATVQAPTFRYPAGGAGNSSDLAAPLLVAGERIDDYEIVRPLGAGSFASVYLARQLSLDREVALKVSPNLGNEARTMASLEHAHIVQVFSETVNVERGTRLLWMQFVPGLTLERVISALNGVPPGTWSGRMILEILDKLSREPTALDTAALQDRETLRSCDFVEAVCWLGARVAQALTYAHSKGVLHRDVKPANILLNQYGRPFLADFNIAATPQQARGNELFGGTLLYMAPEHMRAFKRLDGTQASAVDHRADIYSMGVVLLELFTGKHPFGGDIGAAGTAIDVHTILNERRSLVPSISVQSSVPDSFERILRRCLDPDPERRYGSAGELAQALDGYARLHRANRELSAPGPIGRTAWRRPLLTLVVLSLLPHVLGSVVNIAYNRLCIADDLTATQQTWFVLSVLMYNLVVYPICIWLLLRLIIPVFRTWNRLQTSESVSIEELTHARRRALQLPVWAAILSCAGWLPGGVLFPIAISSLSSPVGWMDFGHFLVSFTVSGLIAMTYSYFGVQYVVLRVLYPRFWTDAAELRTSIAEELGSQSRRMQGFQILAGLIPVVGAALLVCSGPEQLTLSFRLLVTFLLVLGLVGFGVAVILTNELSRVVAQFMAAGRGNNS